MRFFDYISLAFRNIRRQKLRSALTIFAVVIGVMSVTIMLSLVTGAKGFFLSQVEASGTLQQVAISQKADLENFEEAGNGGNCSDCVKLTDEIKAQIEGIDHVVGVARVTNVWNIESISYNGKKLSTERVEAHDANGVIISTPVAGRDLAESDTADVVTLTTQYADKYGFKGNYDGMIGETVTLRTREGYTGVGADIKKPVQNEGPDFNNNPGNQPATELNAKVVGIIASDGGAVVNVPIQWANQMNVNQRWEPVQMEPCQQNQLCKQTEPSFNLIVDDFVAQNGYNSMVAKVDSAKNAGTVAAEIRKLGVGAVDAKEFINEQLTIFQIVGFVLGAIGAIALLVAAIGVVNTMIMAILERTREIGVMRAVGSKRSTVRRLFTTEASMLGFMGGVVGVACGFGLTRIANIFINKQLAENSLSVRNVIGTPPWLVITVISIATLIGMLAGLGPAARAARLDPVEALRYE